MLYIVINAFIGGPLENQLVEGQPSLKELYMKYKYMKYEYESNTPIEEKVCFILLA